MSAIQSRLERLEHALKRRCPACGGMPYRLVSIDPDIGEITTSNMLTDYCDECQAQVRITVNVAGVDIGKI